MKSIDLLCPQQEGDKSEQLPDNLLSGDLIEKMSQTLKEVVDRQTDTNKDLVESFKETIANVISQQGENKGEEVDNNVDDSKGDE